MSRVMFLLGGIGVGAGGMYFFDPEQGDRRRAQLRQRLQVGLDQTLNTLEQGSQELKLRARSVIQEAEQNLVPGQSQGGMQGPQGAINMGEGQRNQLATVAGGALALYGVFRRGIIGSALTTIGVGMLSRGLGLGHEQAMNQGQGFRPGMPGPQGFQPGMPPQGFQPGFQPGMQGPQGFQPGMPQGPGAPLQPGMQGQAMPPQGAPQQNLQGPPQQNPQGPPQQNLQGPPPGNAPGNAQRGPEGNRPREQGPARGA